jgi:hypothetical protein
LSPAEHARETLFHNRQLEGTLKWKWNRSRGIGPKGKNKNKGLIYLWFI